MILQHGFNLYQMNTDIVLLRNGRLNIYTLVNCFPLKDVEVKQQGFICIRMNMLTPQSVADIHYIRVIRTNTRICK